MNYEKIYTALIDEIFPFVLGRPLMIKKGKIYMKKDSKSIAPSHFVGVAPEAFPLQVWTREDLISLLKTHNPSELHRSMGRFFETQLNELIFDLDTSPSSGLESSFAYGKGLYDWINQYQENTITNCRMLYSGNRGFHITVTLKTSHSQPYLKKVMENWIAQYGQTFIGVIDTNMTDYKHFIRVPFSYNDKGGRFAFYVDKLTEFTEKIAQEKSDKIKNLGKNNG